MKTGHKKALGSFPTLDTAGAIVPCAHRLNAKRTYCKRCGMLYVETTRTPEEKAVNQEAYNKMVDLSDMLTTSEERYIVVDPEYLDMIKTAMPHLTQVRVYEPPPVMATIGDYLHWANGEV